jgi:hypothetical protein
MTQYKAWSATAECLRCGAAFSKYREDSKYCCRKCSNCARVAAYTARQPAEVRAQWRKYFYTERGTITALLGNAKDRAARLSLPYDLDREWLAEKLKGGICELSGLPLERVPRTAAGGARSHPFAPSLDRVIPALGYVKWNVRLVCFIVNQARSDFGDEALLTMAVALVSHRAATSMKELTA